MYDDLGSLAEKLKMSGVSFQEMTEDGETMQAVTTTAAVPDISNEVQEPTVAVSPAANRKDASYASAAAAIPANTLSWPKSKPVPVAAPDAFATPAGGILDSVAAISRPAEVEIRERNPVRLDMLFTVIGK
ncbi:hypothetical protein [Kosakonia radicincitans]|uniref:hypothetical protein n=1 Tax=Kosakonia radicincitans TaxID=283686 RepID=UPI0005C30489|nr:hypothetical protein [Kosakonia radicincitans]KIS41936.1 hypothetical protein LG58_4861 [Kosakonia radicincitans YD4]